MIPNISGVILAGGDNKRFEGKTKGNIVIGGKTIIYRIIETIRDIFDEIIIVTNTPEEFRDYNSYKIIPDLFPGVGPIGGIHSSIRESSKEAGFIFAGDMPFLDKEIIIKQIEFYNNNKTDALIPRIDNHIEPLHSIYNISILRKLEEYLNEDNDHSVRGFFKILNIGWFLLEDSEDTRSAFMNINSPSDLGLAEKRLGIL